ncbi:MAG: hypothetical protein ACE5GJ_01265 [Gemmatimonadota bacterium]
MRALGFASWLTPVYTALLVGVAAVPALNAQEIPSPFKYVETKQEAGPMAGYVSFGTGRFGYGPKGGALFGARWGVRLSGPLSFETVASTVRGKRDVVDPGRVEGDRVIDEADVLLGLIDARLSFTFTGDRTWHDLAPFISAGGGMVFDLAGSDPADEKLQPGDRFNFGTGFLGTFSGGTRVDVSSGFSLRLESTFSLNKLDTPPGFSDPDRGFVNVEKGEWVQGVSFTLSGLIRF